MHIVAMRCRMQGGLITRNLAVAQEEEVEETWRSHY